jgi:hypothetical protein
LPPFLGKEGLEDQHAGSETADVQDEEGQYPQRVADVVQGHLSPSQFKLDRDNEQDRDEACSRPFSEYRQQDNNPCAETE